jgi:hypothetical protein
MTTITRPDGRTLYRVNAFDLRIQYVRRDFLVWAYAPDDAIQAVFNDLAEDALDTGNLEAEYADPDTYPAPILTLPLMEA